MTRDSRQSDVQGEALTDVLAEETHSGRVWGLIILLALIVPVLSVVSRPATPARVGLGLAGVIGLGVIAMALAGFQYRFLRYGVEIRMLGFHLRSIPRQAIVSYSIEPWAFIRGYGIRGIGSTRAYVWGNQVVHIKTTSGEIYLGHSDPQRIVRDLDQVTGFKAGDGGHLQMQAATHAMPVTGEVQRKPGSWFVALTCLMWAALPLTALEYWNGWDSFPARMAVHFDASFRLNGFATRENAVAMGLGIMTTMLVLFTVACLSARAFKSEAAWPALVISYIIVGILWYANHSIINFNLNASPPHTQIVRAEISPDV